MVRPVRGRSSQSLTPTFGFCLIRFGLVLPTRFGLKIHAYVLMGNHYHLQVGGRNWGHALRGCCLIRINTQRKHKVRKRRTFEQKAAKLAKFTAPGCCFGEKDHPRFWRDFNCISIRSTLNFSSFANFCSKGLSLRPCCTRRNWATAR